MRDARILCLCPLIMGPLLLAAGGSVSLAEPPAASAIPKGFSFRLFTPRTDVYPREGIRLIVVFANKGDGPVAMPTRTGKPSTLHVKTPDRRHLVINYGPDRGKMRWLILKPGADGRSAGFRVELKNQKAVGLRRLP